MAEAKESGSTQAAKPKKLLKSGVSPDVGKATQFKKGQSGNPAGPKPGYKHMSTWIQELLNDPEFDGWVFTGRAYEQFKGAPMKAIVKAQMIKAMNGDTKSADWLAKYGYGTKVEVSTPEGQAPLALVQIVESGKPKTNS